jgi:hypothetical protein
VKKMHPALAAQVNKLASRTGHRTVDQVVTVANKQHIRIVKNEPAPQQ